MSACTRIIPRLDIKGPNLVKGVQLEGLRVLGRPQEFAQLYYEDGADELLYMDVVAALYGRNSLLPIIERTAGRIFIPLTVGGGIRSMDDIYRALRAGADKVAVNTAAIRNPDLIREAARHFGSQCVVLSIEAKRMDGGRYEAYIDNGREPTGVDVFEWASRACDLGAGEVLVTSVDREGTGRGYDSELVGCLARMLPVPVIASGGAGGPEHVLSAIAEANADAVAIGSILHYSYLKRVYRDHGLVEAGEGNVAFLKGILQGDLEMLPIEKPANIPDLKRFIMEGGVFCRD